MDKRDCRRHFAIIVIHDGVPRCHCCGNYPDFWDYISEPGQLANYYRED